MSTRLLYLIPARKNSKRIPNKNLMLIQGKPLVQYSIETALASKFTHKRIVVSTDSEEIGALAQKLGVEFLRRPAELATDKSPDVEFVRHAQQFLKDQGDAVNYIVHLRPTTPFRDTSLMDEIISKILNTPSADAIRTVERVKVVPEKCVYIDQNGLMRDYFDLDLRDINKPYEHFKTAFTANGYVDVFKNHDFTHSQCMYEGRRVLSYIFDPDQVLDIDEMNDLRRHGVSAT